MGSARVGETYHDSGRFRFSLCCCRFYAPLLWEECPRLAIVTARDAYLLDRYGIDQKRYEEILKAQGGTCAICPTKRKKDGPHLPVDHCHRTGAIRGILCNRCNERLLTAARDDPEVLRRAADYLEQEPWGFVPESRKKTVRKSTRYKNAPAWMRPKGAERKL